MAEPVREHGTGRVPPLVALLVGENSIMKTADKVSLNLVDVVVSRVSASTETSINSLELRVSKFENTVKTSFTHRK